MILSWDLPPPLFGVPSSAPSSPCLVPPLVTALPSSHLPGTAGQPPAGCLSPTASLTLPLGPLLLFHFHINSMEPYLPSLLPHSQTWFTPFQHLLSASL